MENLIGTGAGVWRLLGQRFRPAAEGETPEDAESAQTGGKLRGYPGISGTKSGVNAGTERFTRWIKCRVVSCGGRTRSIYGGSGAQR